MALCCVAPVVADAAMYTPYGTADSTEATRATAIYGDRSSETMCQGDRVW